MTTAEPQGTRRTYSRRTVLKGAAMAGGGVAMVTIGGVGYRSEENGVWNSGKGAPYELWNTWQDLPGHAAIVAAGVLAANPHNTQPWSFTVSGDTIDVRPDGTRTMPITDTGSREHLAGLGCAVENMVIAARARGLDALVETWPSAAVAARVALTEGAAPTARERALSDAISHRHTYRAAFDDAGVGVEDLARLAAGQAGRASVTWVTEPAAVASLGKLYVDATQAIIDDEEMSLEAFTWFRSTRASIEKHRDGLTLDCQGLSPFMLAASKILPATSRKDGDAFWLKSTREVHTATAAAYGVIDVPDAADATDRVSGGRLLERLHVAATADGLAFQHMNQVGERIARDAALGAPDDLSARWESIVGLPAGRSLVAFRIGHPQGTARPSPRRRLEDVLVGA